MPIGITAGAAVIGAGAGIYSASQSAKAQTKAANTAADTGLQVAQMNNDLYKQIYQSNLGVLSPYVNNGVQPSNALNDLLLGTHSFNPTAAPVIGPGGVVSPAAGGPAPGYNGPSFNDIVAMKGDHIYGDMGTAINNWISYYRAHPNENPGITAGQIAGLEGDHVQGDTEAVTGILNAYNARPPSAATATPAAGTAGAPAAGGTAAQGERPMLADFRGDLPGYRAAMAAWRGAAPAAGTVTTPGTGTGGNGALSAWDQFRNGTNYQWRLNQGEAALAGNYAAHGMFDSGAEKKALLTYGQNFASNELSNYMNLLAGQQAMGLSAAGAVAGVGTTYAGNVAAQNTNAANAAANAALVKGQGSANMWGAIGQGVGQLSGALSQYGAGMPTASAFPSFGSANSYVMPVNAGGSTPYPYMPGGFY